MSSTQTHDPQSGHWQDLDNSIETQRYRALAVSIGNAASIMDVGCGTGLLSRHLNQLRYFAGEDFRYHGIDPSSLAIAEAKRQGVPRVAVDTAENYVNFNRKFDCIVFNEVLYYMDYPPGVLNKFARMLNPGGRLVISIFRRPESLRERAMVLAKSILWPYKPHSNVHCLDMVVAHLINVGWSFETEVMVSPSDARLTWEILTVTP